MSKSKENENISKIIGLELIIAIKNFPYIFGINILGNQL